MLNILCFSSQPQGLIISTAMPIAVEERIATIMSAAEDAIVSLKNDLKTKIVRLPKAVSKDFATLFLPFPQTTLFYFLLLVNIPFCTLTLADTGHASQTIPRKISR